MKAILKKVLYIKLRFFSRAILKKYKPTIVAVTGSVGKTTTKEAIYSCISGQYNARKSEKNFNNEIGVPLSIIGVTLPASFFGWFFVFVKALWMLLFRQKNYPEILVLEMGADRPGDMTYLTKFAKPHISVVTNVSESHLEFFESVENIAEEKSKLVTCLRATDFAVLNYDDSFVYEMRKKTKAQIITFGFSKNADVSAKNISLTAGKNYQLKFNIEYAGKKFSLSLNNIVAKHFIYPICAAFAVGVVLDLNAEEIIKSMKSFSARPGRMNVIAGIKGTTLIDDTYNASPVSTKEALKDFAQLPKAAGVKRYAVLGDMRELGSITENAHRQVGAQVFENKIDYLITAGEIARDIARGAKKAGMPEDKIFSFKDSSEAGKFLQQRMKKGDLILVKGSQAVRMERVVKEVMAQPLKASELLVRQEKKWSN